MSRAVPPLAAIMRATPRAALVLTMFDALVPLRVSSSVNPSGSRVRAISEANVCGDRVVISQASPGRITSPQISNPSAAPNVL